MDTTVTKQAVLEELAAIGFARATDCLQIKNGSLELADTDALPSHLQAAIASVERSSGGLKVKFYDKLKALELLGKLLGMFEGGMPEQQENNLLEAIVGASREEVATHDIPELQ